MKIGLDLRMLEGGSGIGRYVQELSAKILTLDKANEYVLFFNKITPSIDALYRRFGWTMVATGIPHYSVAEQIRLPFILNRYKLDVMHFPHFNVPILYARPFVVTIHDLTHTKFPGKKKSHFIHRLGYNLILANAIKRAKRIIAVSNYTKGEILEYFKISEKKIEVVYEGIATGYGMVNKDEAFTAVSHNFQIAKPFILYVGVWRRYKNLPNLAKAFDKIAEKFDYNLVLAGQEDPFYPEIREQIFSIKNADRVKALGRVNDIDLKLLYNAADLVVLPSLEEGFGLTVLESAACGTAVACSDIPTLREVMGQAAEYFDPHNVDNMADVMAGLLENPVKREELANAGLRRSAHFDWKESALATIKVYGSVKA